MSKFTKQDIYKNFKKAKFPNEIISKEALNYYDFLFEDAPNKKFIDESMIYGNNYNKRDLSESFFSYTDTMCVENNKYKDKYQKGKDQNWRKNVKDNERPFSNYNNYKDGEYNKFGSRPKNNLNNNLKDKQDKNYDLDFSLVSFSLNINTDKNFKIAEKNNNKKILKDYNPNDSDTDRKIIKNKKKPNPLKDVNIIENNSGEEKFNKNLNKNKKKINNENENKNTNNCNGNNTIFDENLKAEINKQEKLRINEDHSTSINFITVEANEIECPKLENFSKNDFCVPLENNNILTNINFTENLNFKKIYQINKQLKYPENKPLWYINHPEANSSFGPLSTKQLDDMYTKKEINKTTKIRFIDLIKFKNKANFEFINIKELETPNILMDIEMSGLFKSLSAELASIKVIDVKTLMKTNNNINNQISHTSNKNLKKENKKPVKIIKESSEPLDLPKYDKSLFEFKKEENPIFNNKISKLNTINDYNLNKEAENFNDENISNDNIKDIHNLINRQMKNVFDEEHDYNYIVAENKKESEKNYKKTLEKDLDQSDKGQILISNNDHQKDFGLIKSKTKKKGKPQKMNIDVKTGFYTLTEQEKVYDPIYIVGEHK